MRFKSVAAIILFIAFAFLFNPSCQQEITDPNPPVDTTTVHGLTDSTLLIKSISYALHDSSTGAVYDSSAYYYFYDTTNRKVYVTLAPLTNFQQPFDGIEYNYDTARYLRKIVTHYVATPDPEDIHEIAYTYDAANIIMSADKKLYNNTVQSTSFVKQSISQGYQLSWQENDINNPGLINWELRFANDGKLRGSSYSLDNVLLEKDSLAYTANGSFAKKEQTFFYYGLNPPDSSFTHTQYDFLTRETKGNALYMFYKNLLKGLDNFPASAISSNLVSPEGEIDEYAYQYTVFPSLQTRIHVIDPVSGNQYFTDFNGAATFDASGRLTNCKVFYNDQQLDYVTIRIQYYK